MSTEQFLIVPNADDTSKCGVSVRSKKLTDCLRKDQPLKLSDHRQSALLSSCWNEARVTNT